jgi:hypothetical protein
MSDSRINVNLVDQSGFVAGGVPVVRGGAVIGSAKGTEKPQWFDAGSETEILRRLGYPSATYPDVWEVIDFNREFGIWVSAPSNTGLHGGVIATTTGTKALTEGVADPSAFVFTAIPFSTIVGTGDGVETNFTTTIELPYVNQSLTLIRNGSTDITVTATDAEPEVLSGTGLSAGTLTRATGALDITFTTAPTDGDSIVAVYQIDLSLTAYYALFTKSPHAETEKLLQSYNTNTGLFDIEFYITDNRSKDVLVRSYSLSQIEGTQNGFKENVYIDDYLVDDPYLIGVSNDLAYTAFTDDTTRVIIGGGSRGSAISLTELTAGWTYFQSSRLYPTTIHMDYSADAGIPTIFDTLRTTYNKYADYILPLPDSEDVSTSIATKAGYSINERGLAFYWNWKKVKEKYNSTQFWTSQIGGVGKKWGQMYDIYNGLAPAMVDEGGHGGQVSGGAIELRYDPSDTDVVDLANAGINPIVFDPNYGVMILHQRTGQTPNTLSDTSFIGHSRLIDLIINSIIVDVLTFQLIKLNDTNHQTQVRTKTEAILNPMLGANLLREFLVKCDDENNTDEVKSRREFKLAVSIKVTPFSETITLDFILSPQGVSVEETIG